VWPFTRKSGASKTQEAATSAPPPVHFEWKEVPPIQRVISDHPLTVPTDRFADELATHQDPRAVAEPLGHLVSLEAPRGLLLGLVQPRLRHDGPELVQRIRPTRPMPVQRTAPEAIGIADANDLADAGGFAMDSALASPATPPLASVERPLQRTTLTHVGADNAPVPLPLRRDVVLAGSVPAVDPGPEAPEPLPAYPRLTLGQARRLGLGAPLSRVPDTAVQRAVERPAISSVGMSAAAATTEEAAYSPIFPLDLPSPKPVVAPAPISRPQRIPTPLPLARPQAASSDEPVDEARAIETTQTSTTAQPVIAPLAGSQPVATATDPRITTLDEPVKGDWEGIDEPRQPLPLAGTPAPTTEGTTVDSAPSPTPPPATEVAGGVGAQPMTAPATEESPTPSVPLTFAPLLSERSIVTTAVQRAPEGVPSSIGSAPTDSVPRGVRGVRIHRGQEAAMQSAALGARAFTEGDDIYLPRWHGSLRDAPARSLLAHELVHVGQQRRMTGGLPAEASEDGRRMESEALSVERSVASTGVTTIQRAPEPTMGGPASLEARSTLSAAQPVAGESPAQTRNEETHLNELAAKLYEKIRSRLRNELLVDRERAGFLTDLR
jgi:hypothetical protein